MSWPQAIESIRIKGTSDSFLYCFVHSETMHSWVTYRTAKQSKPDASVLLGIREVIRTDREVHHVLVRILVQLSTVHNFFNCIKNLLGLFRSWYDPSVVLCHCSS